MIWDVIYNIIITLYKGGDRNVCKTDFCIYGKPLPGRLAEITKILSENSVDIRAINIADTTDFGILRMIVDDEENAEKVLRGNNMTANISDVIAISISRQRWCFQQCN